MNTREIARRMIRRHEALRLKPYLDTVGKLTIGYGRNLDDRGISEFEAEQMLEVDITIAIDDARFALGKREFKALGEIRAAVLVDMSLNLGRDRLSGFKKMLAALRAKDYETAADEMIDSKWYRQVGVRGVELEGIMRTGRVA